MEWFAAQVRDLLGVPVALVSLVHADEQVFPGMCGLPEPWATRRSTPLTHSFCRHVVATAEPLIVRDARAEPLVRDNLAIPDLGVIAYAGMPLTDDAGRVLGSLCAIDTEPRSWTAAELGTLRLLATACSTELRLRLARHDAATERRRTDAAEARAHAALRRSQLLLTMSRALTDADTVDQIAAAVASIALDDTPSRTRLLLVADDTAMLRGTELPDSAVRDIGDATGTLTAHSSPTALRAARGGRAVHAIRPRPTSVTGHAPASVSAAPGDAQPPAATLCVPVIGLRGAWGVIETTWDTPREADALDAAAVTAVAGYTAQALDRLRFLQGRISVAHLMQTAMLTDLPVAAGVDLAARYEPATVTELVGGDWYDAFPLPTGGLALAVGDVIGHDINAAVLMAQLRSMLRQACWDTLTADPAAGPSAAIAALDHAAAHLGVDGSGTLVLAYLCPPDSRHPDGHDDGNGDTPPRGWTVRWANAGHPPPILAHPDGTTRELDGSDQMLGVIRFVDRLRADHTAELPAGSALILHSDGLVEDRGDAFADNVARLHAQLRAALAPSPRANAVHTGPSAADLVRAAFATRRATAPPDDVAILVARLT